MSGPELTAAERRALRREAALRLVYPRRCPLCGEVLGSVPVCADCRQTWQSLLLRPARLDPKDHYFGELTGAAAAFRYEGPIRQAILRMKYGGARWYARDCGNWMAKALFGCTFLQEYGILIPVRAPAAGMAFDVIVPVPRSDRKRGYHMPALLAWPLAKGLGLPLETEVLVRTRFTRHQAGLAMAERLANVAGAFAPVPGHPLDGRRVLLVDDVITTGATMAACAAALYQDGAQEVFAVGLASASPAQHTMAGRSA